MNYSPLS